MEQLLAQLFGGGGGGGSGAALPYLPKVSVPNHYAPLQFETFGGSTHDSEVQEESRVNFACGPIQEHMHLQREDFRSDAAYRAALLALEAHKFLPHKPEQAAERAQRALEISPLCPEAHNVLAVLSGSYEAALEHYQRGEEVGLQVVPPEHLQQELAREECWERAVLRPYLRALFGVSNTLRKLGRYFESLPKYEQLCRLSGQVGGIGTKPNWHAHLPELWYRVYGPQECLARAARHPQREACAEYMSSQGCWLYTLGLAQFASGQVRDYRGFNADNEDFDAPGVIWRLAHRGHPLLLAVQQHDKACPYLLGERPLPSNTIPDETPAGGYSQAAVYAKMSGDLWRSVPGALDFLKKMYHTQCYAKMLTDNARRPHEDVFDAEAALRHVEAGVFPNVVTTPAPGPDITFMHGTVSLGSWRHGVQAHQARLVQALLKCGGNPRLRDSQGLTQLHQASYNAAGAETIRLLVGAGADPMVHNGMHPSPLEMTANQGNADEMDAFLTTCPHLCSMVVQTEDPYTGERWRGTVLENLLNMCFQSSCLVCLAGGPKCQRCENDCPHNPTASFHRCIEVLVRHGLRCNPQVLSVTKELVRDSPPPFRSMVRDLVQHLVEASLAADASGAGPGSGRSGAAPAAASSTAAAGQTPSSSAGAAGSAAGAAGSAAAATAADSGSIAASAAAGSSSAAALGGSASQPKRCANCGTREGKLLKCKGCRAVYFCSADCQKENWQSHKAACKEVQRQRAAAEGGSGPPAAAATG